MSGALGKSPSESTSEYIIFLEQFLKVAAENRTTSQSPAEWEGAVRARLKPSTMSLHNYGGGELAIVSQVCCRLRQGGREIDTTLQVQKEVPVDRLLGTDTLPKLGITLVQTEKATGPYRPATACRERSTNSTP